MRIPARTMVVAWAGLALLVAAHPGGARAADRAGAAALINRVEVRRGVVHRNLVVLPLVLRDGLEVDGPEPASRDGARWCFPGNGRPGNLVEARRAGGDGATDPSEEKPAGDILLPGGLLLQGAPRERLLRRPLLLSGEAAPRTRVRTCGSPRADETKDLAGTWGFGPVAPLDQRKIDFLIGDDDALTDVLAIQGAICGIESKDLAVADILTAPAIAKPVADCRRALAPVAQAFAATASGYVAFLGLRPVEIVLYRDPRVFAREAPDLLRSLAVTAAIWERFYGRDSLPEEKADIDALLRQTRRLLDDVARAPSSAAGPRSGERGGGTLRTIATKGDDRSGQWRPPLAGRILQDADENALLLEVFENGSALVLPAPLSGPEERPVDEKPDIKQGAMTWEYLSRLAARRAAMR